MYVLYTYVCIVYVYWDIFWEDSNSFPRICDLTNFVDRATMYEIF